ncbi:TerB family tellurite resistance protein [Microvirga thermotolerans]|nr:TerB family tellurite resistance protein [Microvirga thermotolerans]
MSHLRAFFGPAAVPEGAVEHGERFTVAALLALVTHADGRRLAVEEAEMRSLLQARFGLTIEEAESLVARARGGAAMLDPATSLIDRIVRDIPPAERPGLLALAYRIAASDGVVHAFEDDLIWRTGRLLGLTEAEFSAVRREALAPHASGDRHG